MVGPSARPSPLTVPNRAKARARAEPVKALDSIELAPVRIAAAPIPAMMRMASSRSSDGLTALIRLAAANRMLPITKVRR